MKFSRQHSLKVYRDGAVDRSRPPWVAPARRDTCARRCRGILGCREQFFVLRTLEKHHRFLAFTSEIFDSQQNQRTIKNYLLVLHSSLIINKAMWAVNSCCVWAPFQRRPFSRRFDSMIFGQAKSQVDEGSSERKSRSYRSEDCTVSTSPKVILGKRWNG